MGSSIITAISQKNTPTMTSVSVRDNRPQRYLSFVTLLRRDRTHHTDFKRAVLFDVEANIPPESCDKERRGGSWAACAQLQRAISTDTMRSQGRSRSGSQQAWNNSVKNGGGELNNGIKSVHGTLSVTSWLVYTRGVYIIVKYTKARRAGEHRRPVDLPPVCKLRTCLPLMLLL